MQGSSGSIEKIICYLRRSRQDLEREKKTGEDTLSIQKKIMCKVLDGMTAEYDVLEEIGSGDKIEYRPVFQQILQRLQEGAYNAIAVKEIARLGRGSYSDMGTIFDLLKTRRIYIITPYKIYDIENPSDARQVRFELFFAREEFEMIRERMLASKIGLAHEGRWVAGAAPYGYRLNSKTSRLEVKEESAAVVRYIFDLFVHGREPGEGFRTFSLRDIAEHLNDLGIPSPRHGSGGWRYNTVKRIIENPVYAGMLKYRTRKRVGNRYYARPEKDWIVIEHNHEPLVSGDTWNRARQKLAGTPRKARAGRDQQPCELAGLVFCTRCGRRMVRQHSVQHYTKKDGSRSVYRKEFLWCTTRGCTFVKYRDVEESILDFLSRLDQLNSKELKAYIKKSRQAGAARGPGEVIEQRRQELERKLQFVYDKYEQGIYSDAEFRTRKNTLESELAGLAGAGGPQIKNPGSPVMEYSHYVKKLARFYRCGLLNRGEKNQLLSELIAAVYLVKTGRGNFDITIFPRPVARHFWCYD